MFLLPFFQYEKNGGFLHITFYEKCFLGSYFLCAEASLQYVSLVAVLSGGHTLGLTCGLFTAVASLTVGNRFSFPPPHGIFISSLRIEPKKEDSQPLNCQESPSESFWKTHCKKRKEFPRKRSASKHEEP